MCTFQLAPFFSVTLWMEIFPALQIWRRRGRTLPGMVSAFSGRLDLNAVCRILKVTVPDPYVPDTAGHLASQREPVSELADAVKDPYVFTWSVDDISLRIFPCFDCHRVVSCIKGAAENRTIPGGIRVPAISVPDISGTEMASVCHNIF